MEPFTFETTQPLKRIYSILKGLGYERKSDSEPDVYARDGEELKIQMGKLGPLGKRLLEYRGKSIETVEEFQEIGLDQ